MPTLQEMIHSFEEGMAARVVKWVGFTVAFIALAIAYDLRAWRNFANPEAMDTAQLARNMAGGQGYTTQFIRPVSLYLLGQKTGAASLTNAHPDLANAPAWPTLLAGAMRLAKVEDRIPADEPFSSHAPELLIAGLNQGLFFLVLMLSWLSLIHI